MSDVRVLFDPHRIAPQPGDGAPRAHGGRDMVQARQQLGEYLDAKLMRPLYCDDAQQHQRVETALDTMTRAERIVLEIEMTERVRQSHSFDYDPLR